MSKIVALNPVSLPLRPVEASAVTLSDLGGRTLAFFSNNKPNTDALLEGLAGRLRSRFGIVARHYNKGIPSLEAPAELLDRICRECQGVVLAAFD